MAVYYDDFDQSLRALELDATCAHDRGAVRKAYARLAKLIRPEVDADAFQRLREAYETALEGVTNGVWGQEEYVDPDPELEPPQPDSMLLPPLVPLPVLVSSPADRLQEPLLVSDTRALEELRAQISDALQALELNELLKLTEQLLNHPAMDGLQLAFETRNWLINTAAWNENAPSAWLEQIRTLLKLDLEADDYRSNEFAIERFFNKLQLADRWSSLRSKASLEPKSPAGIVLKPANWFGTFWSSFDRDTRAQINDLLAWIESNQSSDSADHDSAANSATNSVFNSMRPSADKDFKNRWLLANQFAAFGKIKTCLLLFFSFILTNQLSVFFYEQMGPFGGLLQAPILIVLFVLAVLMSVVPVAAVLWLGGRGLDQLRQRLTPHFARLSWAEIWLNVLVLVLLPFVLSPTTESTFLTNLFYCAVFFKVLVDVITGQFATFLVASGEMLTGLAIFYFIILWLVWLGSGADFSANTAIAGWFVFLAMLPVSAVSIVGAKYLTLRNSKPLPFTPKLATITLIALLIIHAITTQMATPLASYVNTSLAAIALVLCYLTVSAAGLPWSTTKGFILFSLIAAGMSQAFMKTVEQTMPLVRFQILDLYLIVNLSYSLYAFHKAAKLQNPQEQSFNSEQKST